MSHPEWFRFPGSLLISFNSVYEIKHKKIYLTPQLSLLTLGNTWQLGNPHVHNRKYIFKWWIFNSHVCFRKGTGCLKLDPYNP